MTTTSPRIRQVSLRRNVVANYLGQGWAALMGLAFVPLYVRALGVESFGLIGVFAILQAWMTLLDFGLSPTLSREMARLRAGAHDAQSIHDLLRSLEVISAGLAVLMIVLVWMAAPALGSGWLRAERLPEQVVVHAIEIMGVVLALRWLEQVFRGALQGLQDFVWLNGANALLATLRWGGAYAIVAIVSPTIKAFFYWQGAVSLLTAGILVWRTYAVLPAATRTPRFDVGSLRRVRQFAGGMFLGSLLILLLTQVDKVLVSKLLSLEQLGYYMFAASAAGALMQLVNPMNIAIYPRLTEAVTAGDQAGLTTTYIRSCAWMSAVIVPPALLMAFFSGPLLLLWTGDANLTRAVAPLLTLLALGTLCNGLMTLPYMLQLAHGWTGLAVRVNLAAVLLIVPALLWAVPRYGTIGAATAWLALNAGYVLVGAQLMYRKLLPDVKWRWYRQAILRPLAAGSIAGMLLVLILPVATSRPMAAMIVLVALPLQLLAVVSSMPDQRKSMLRYLRTLQRARTT